MFFTSIVVESIVGSSCVANTNFVLREVNLMNAVLLCEADRLRKLIWKTPKYSLSLTSFDTFLSLNIITFSLSKARLWKINKLKFTHTLKLLKSSVLCYIETLKNCLLYISWKRNSQKCTQIPKVQFRITAN